MAEGRDTQKDYGLHRAAFHGDVRRVKEILETLRDTQQGEEDTRVNLPDEHGEFLKNVYSGEKFCVERNS